MNEFILTSLLYIFGITIPNYAIENKQIDLPVVKLTDYISYNFDVYIIRSKYKTICNELPRYCVEIIKSALTNDIDPYRWASVIKLESNGRKYIRGSKGEYGISQLMPYHVAHLSYKDRFEIETNLVIGVRYFKKCLGQWKSYPRASGAYNAGVKNIYYNSKYVEAVLKNYKQFKGESL